MIQRFTEMYYDDALRFAKFIQATEGGEIEIVKEDAEGFPLPPKHRVLDNMVNCIKIRNYEVAYLGRRKDMDDDKKMRNRTLHRFIIGQKLKEVRELSGISIGELSEKSGYKPNNIKNIEDGRFSPDTDTLCNILDAMDAHLEIVKD